MGPVRYFSMRATVGWSSPPNWVLARMPAVAPITRARSTFVCSFMPFPVLLIDSDIWSLKVRGGKPRRRVEFL